MGLLSVDELKPGMVLERDVLAPNGRLLLGTGTELTPRNITVLKTWGVVDAHVQGDGQEHNSHQEPTLTRELLDHTRQQLQPFFACTDLSLPAMREIFKLALYQAAGQGMGHFVIPASCNTGDQTPNPEKILAGHPLVTAADIIAEQTRLATFPDIYHQINAVLQSPRSSATHIAEVVSKDSSLSGKLLRLVNSPFYGFPRKIDTIPRAVAILGTNELSTLALGISVVHYFSGISQSSVDMKSFWRHSIACGVLSRLLADKQQGLSEETFFVAGLTHDIGRLVMFNHFPGPCGEILEYAARAGMPLFQAESRVLGFDHALLGGELLKKWHFPISLENPVRFHHQPCSALNILDPSIVHVADILAQALNFGSSGNLFVPPLNSAAWQELKMNKTVFTWVKSMALRQVYEIERIFLGGTHD